MSNKTALIIGAGPAGLTCAYELLTKTDIHPIILEESPYIGGISRTAQYKSNRMDLGGHRFFSKNDDIMALWKEIMPVQGAPARDDKLLGREKPLASGGPDPEKEDAVMLVRDRVSRIFYLRRFFDYPISLKAQTFKNMGFSRTMKAGLGYISACRFQTKRRNSRRFLYQPLRQAAVRDVFRGLHEQGLGHPSVADRAGLGVHSASKGLSLSKAIFNILKKPFIGKKR